VRVERVFVKPKSGGPQSERDHVTVVAGTGIEGDQYFGRHEAPGLNLTLVEAEEIETFLTEHKRPLDLSITSRNLVTRGVRLSELIGREFYIGDVKLLGVELCEPCSRFGKAIASADLPAAAVVKRFVHRAGIRADVLTSGTISRGAAVTGAA
jgi:MOSC domain-containing protein YiiM